MQSKSIETEFWWKPDENTLLYLPMESDLLDHSWKNVSITNYWISINNTLIQNKWIWYFKGSTTDRLQFSWIEFWTKNFTISRREYPLSNSSSKWTRFATKYESQYAWLLLWYQWTQLYCWTWWTARNIFSDVTVFSSTLNTRTHRVVVRNWNSRKFYRNKVQVWSGTSSSSLWYWTEVVWNYRPWDNNPFLWYMSKFIIEREPRTQSDIDWYYEKSKKYFWL